MVWLRREDGGGTNLKTQGMLAQANGSSLLRPRFAVWLIPLLVKFPRPRLVSQV